MSSSTKGAELLLRAGVVTQAIVSEIASFVAGTKKRSEDALVDVGYLDEPTLLKGLAAVYRVNFVSTEKLSRLDIPKSTLNIVPRRVAELLCVFPVSFDSEKRELRVVTPDPDDVKMLTEIQELSGAREVKAFVARPAAVMACIRKHHLGELGAFSAFQQSSAAAASFDAQVLMPDGRLAVGPASGPRSQPPASSGAPISVQKPPSSFGSSHALQNRQAMDVAPVTVRRHELEPALERAAPRSSAETDARVVASLEIAATFADNARAGLRGHSAAVARLVRRMGEARGLPADEVAALYLAGLVHDFGKPNDVHATPISATREPVQRSVATVASYPARMLERVGLPESTLSAVLHMYERWDGRGAPRGLVADQIPKGATLLAVADTYFDLLKNPSNPYGRVLSAEEALGVISQAAGSIFDPEALGTLARALMEPSLDDRLKAQVVARATGRLTITNPAGERAEVWLLEGAIVHAVCMNASSAGLELVGTPAFFAALALSEAESAFDGASSPKQRSIVEGTAELLAEAARRRR